MASARLYCSFLLLYLQGIQGQQTSGNNQNIGVNNNVMALQQQAMQRRNGPNNGYQNQNGTPNMNYPQQGNYQQGNAQQPMNSPGNMQQPINIQSNMQPQGGSVPVNVQIIRPQQTDMSSGNPNVVTGAQSPQGTVNPSFTGMSSHQPFNSAGTQSAQGIPQKNMGPNSIIQGLPQQNMGPNSNIPISQNTNVPISASAYAEYLKNQPSLMSLVAPQYNVPSQQNQQACAQNSLPQQNQQLFAQNAIPPQNQQVQNQIALQNQLTDAEKQTLVRSLLTQQPVLMQNQLGLAAIQNQARIDNQQFAPVPGQQIASFQPIVTPIGNQPAFIPVQALPLTNFYQNQGYNPVDDDEASIMSLIISELQPSSPQYAIASALAMPKKGKSSLKTLIPIIINLLKEKNGCGCRNCACQNGYNNNGNTDEPTVIGGYSNQKNYSERKEEYSEAADDDVGIIEGAPKKQKSYKKNVVNVDFSEASEENDSEYSEDEDT